jgi:hypothetical protein
MADVHEAIKLVAPDAEVACFCEKASAVIDNLENLMEASTDQLRRFTSATVFLLVEASESCFATVAKVLKRYSTSFGLVLPVLMEQFQGANHASMCKKMSTLVQNGADDVAMLPASGADLSVTISACLAKGKAHRQVTNALKKKLRAATQQSEGLFWGVAHEILPEFPEEQPAMPEIPETRFGDYSFLKTLGEGNFGIVHKCQHLQSGDSCAVKVFPKANIKSHRHLQEIITEYTVLSEIRHANVVSGLEFLHGPRNLYIVMEMAGPTTLFKLMATEGQNGLPWVRVRKFLLEIASGLGSLHEIDIAHCDLKPENICISEDGSAKLLDFGQAVDVTEEIPELRFPRGTMPFIAPEVMSCSPQWDPIAGDLWQVGVIILEMICGNHSFEKVMGWRGTSLEEISTQQRAADLIDRFDQSAKAATLEEMFKSCSAQPCSTATSVLTDMLELAPQRRLPARLVAARLG